jgi:predicted RNA-binding protein with PUA-like domain
MSARWLLKTEPSSYSYAALEREGRTVWDGVKNPGALKHLRAVRKGDLLFIYHTGDEKAVVGVARALGPAYPDPGKNDPRLVVIELAPVRSLARPVSLAQIKASRAFKDSDLVRQPRLSVMPVSDGQWTEVERLAES